MQNKISKVPYKNIRQILAVPFIITMAIPLSVFDICAEVYHRIAFPLYGIKYVKRTQYIKVDRHKLKYLKFIDKVWCMYCGYANGFLGYAVEIAGQTENYWCGIKHQPTPGFHEPKHHKYFIAYGDEAEYNKRYEE